MKKPNVKVEGPAGTEPAKSEIRQVLSVQIDEASLEALADKVAERLMPVLFVCARVASRDTIRTPMRDLRAIFKDVVEEARVAHGFFADSMN